MHNFLRTILDSSVLRITKWKMHFQSSILKFPILHVYANDYDIKCNGNGRKIMLKFPNEN